MRWLRELHHVKVTRLRPVIGSEAARCAVIANEWQAAGLFILLLVGTPGLSWVVQGAPVAVSVVTALAWIAFFATVAISIPLTLRGYRFASAFASEALGVEVRLRGGGTNVPRWERRIERARAAALHNDT